MRKKQTTLNRLQKEWAHQKLFHLHCSEELTRAPNQSFSPLRKHCTKNNNGDSNSFLFSVSKLQWSQQAKTRSFTKEKEITKEYQSCSNICIFMPVSLFIYSIHVYTYAYVYMVVIRRRTVPPLINLMFLGEHTFSNCIPADWEENEVTSAGMDMWILWRYIEIYAYFLKIGKSTQVLFLTQQMLLQLTVIIMTQRAKGKALQHDPGVFFSSSRISNTAYSQW